MNKKTLLQINNFRFQQQYKYYSNLSFKENSAYVFLRDGFHKMSPSIMELSKRYKMNFLGFYNFNKFKTIKNVPDNLIRYFDGDVKKFQYNDNIIYVDLFEKAMKNTLVNDEKIQEFKIILKKHFYDILVEIKNLKNHISEKIQKQVNHFFNSKITNYNELKYNNYSEMNAFLLRLYTEWRELLILINNQKIQMLFDARDIFSKYINKENVNSSRRLDVIIKNNEDEIKIIKNIVENPNLSYNNLLKAQSFKQEKKQLINEFNETAKHRIREFKELKHKIGMMYKPSQDNIEYEKSNISKYRYSIYQYASKKINKIKKHILYLNDEQFEHFKERIYEELYFFAITEETYHRWTKQRRTFNISIKQIILELINDVKDINQRNIAKYNKKIHELNKKINTNLQMVAWQQNNDEIHNLLTNKYYSYHEAISLKKWLEDHRNKTNERQISSNERLSKVLVKDSNSTQKKIHYFINEIITNLKKNKDDDSTKLLLKFLRIKKNRSEYENIDISFKIIENLFKKHNYHKNNHINNFYKMYTMLSNMHAFELNPITLTGIYSNLEKSDQKKIGLLNILFMNNRIIEICLDDISINSVFGTWFYNNINDLIKLNDLTVIYDLNKYDLEWHKKVEFLDFNRLIYSKSKYIVYDEAANNVQNINEIIKNANNILLSDYVNIAKRTNVKTENTSSLTAILKRNLNVGSQSITDSLVDVELQRYVK